MPNTYKAQSWDNCNDDIKQFVLYLVNLLGNNLKDNLVGIYLHGSLAMGSYYRPKSDLDLIIVVKNPIGEEVAKTTGKDIAEASLRRPTTGNVELSIITSKYC